jgi:hypothetical protein
MLENDGSAKIFQTKGLDAKYSKQKVYEREIDCKTGKLQRTALELLSFF